MARLRPEEIFERFSSMLRRLRWVARQAYANLELGSTQGKFLLHIDRQSRISQADLARATDTDPALTGRALETLIERGWVRRTRSEEDRRQYVLELAPSGQRAKKKVEEARLRIAEDVAAVLDDRDVEDLDRIAGKILAAFEDPRDRGEGP